MTQGSTNTFVCSSVTGAKLWPTTFRIYSLIFSGAFIFHFSTDIPNIKFKSKLNTVYMAKWAAFYLFLCYVIASRLVEHLNRPG
jgi:hypothetical protein